MRVFLLSSVAFALLAACGAGSTPGDGEGGDGSGNNTSNNGGSSGQFTTSDSTSNSMNGIPAGSGGGTPDDCSDESKLVYVFTSQNQIYSFNPPTKEFQFVATPDCAAGGASNSMAVDRNLVAYINYIGSIYTFDLKTKTGCQLFMNLPGNFQQIGMGFATDGAGTDAETLFIDSISGQGLARVDLASKQVIPIGSFSNDPKLSGGSAELTGTGDGRLYGYFTTFPYVRVAEIDKSNADAKTDDELTGVTPPSSWAFSFWGGELYLYAAPGNNGTGNSGVIRYNPATGAVDENYIADAGFSIVGAGVSTCAPTSPPE